MVGRLTAEQCRVVVDAGADQRRRRLVACRPTADRSRYGDTARLEL